MKKRVGLIASAMLLSMAHTLPVSAAVTETQTVEGSGSRTETCEVEVVVGGGFNVKIPKKIVLSGTDHTAEYEVTVWGNIGGTEEITVVPDQTFELQQSPKDPVTAAVMLNKMVFNDDDLANVMQIEVADLGGGTRQEYVFGDTTTGKVFADGSTKDGDDGNGIADTEVLSAGDWEGTFNFAITLQDKN